MEYVDVVMEKMMGWETLYTVESIPSTLLSCVTVSTNRLFDMSIPKN